MIFNIDFATRLSGVTIAIFPMILWDRDNFFVIIQIRCVSHHLLQLPGSHLRWQYHCRKAFRRWRAGACSDAPVWRRFTLDHNTKMKVNKRERVFVITLILSISYLTRFPPLHKMLQGQKNRQLKPTVLVQIKLQDLKGVLNQMVILSEHEWLFYEGMGRNIICYRWAQIQLLLI